VRRGARRARGGVNRVVLCFLRNRGSCFFPISVEAGRNGSVWYFDWGEAIVAGARGRPALAYGAAADSFANVRAAAGGAWQTALQLWQQWREGWQMEQYVICAYEVACDHRPYRPDRLG
jgi:hypothetical protein